MQQNVIDYQDNAKQFIGIKETLYKSDKIKYTLNSILFKTVLKIIDTIHGNTVITSVMKGINI
jgi:hypothetical protein